MQMDCVQVLLCYASIDIPLCVLCMLILVTCSRSMGFVPSLHSATKIYINNDHSYRHIFTANGIWKPYKHKFILTNMSVVENLKIVLVESDYICCVKKKVIAWTQSWAIVSFYVKLLCNTIVATLPRWLASTWSKYSIERV